MWRVPDGGEVLLCHCHVVDALPLPYRCDGLFSEVSWGWLDEGLDEVEARTRCWEHGGWVWLDCPLLHMLCLNADVRPLLTWPIPPWMGIMTISGEDRSKASCSAAYIMMSSFKAICMTYAKLWAFSIEMERRLFCIASDIWCCYALTCVIANWWNLSYASSSITVSRMYAWASRWESGSLADFTIYMTYNKNPYMVSTYIHGRTM